MSCQHGNTESQLAVMTVVAVALVPLAGVWLAASGLDICESAGMPAELSKVFN